MKKNLACLYNIKKSFKENFNTGPQFSGIIPARYWPDKKEWLSFLGYKIASPIGIPAYPIMTSKGIKLMAQLGYDVLTYKTVRSIPFPAHRLPNISYVSIDKQLSKEDMGTQAFQYESAPSNIEQLAIANSFGNASFEPRIMFYDITQARTALTEGQILIVSVFGTEQTERTLIEDFTYTAQLAQEAGAHIIEANLACPNVASCKPMHTNAKLVYEISKKIVKNIQIPLIIKVGIFENQNQLKETLCAAACAGARGVCGINTIPMHIVDANLQATFGQERTIAGVSGNPIRTLALDFIKQAHKIIDQEKLDLVLLSTGGITKTEHFSSFLDAGATIAMSATGTMWNPYLAIEYHTQNAQPFIGSHIAYKQSHY